MKFELDNKIFDVQINRKKIKNLYIRVIDSNTISISVNLFVTLRQIEKILENNKDFIRKSVLKLERKKVIDNNFYYLGNKYDLVFVPTMKEIQIDFENKYIYCKDELSLNKFILKKAKDIFSERLKSNYELFEEKIPFPNLKIRSMKTRWGVCNRKTKTVTLNLQLIHYSFDKIDYVIIHELSHFIHFDHSKNFWNLVFKYCINHKKIRKELNDI